MYERHTAGRTVSDENNLFLPLQMKFIKRQPEYLSQEKLQIIWCNFMEMMALICFLRLVICQT